MQPLDGARASPICRARFRSVALALAAALLTSEACAPHEPELQNPGVSTVNLGTAARVEPSPDAARARWEGSATLDAMKPAGPAFASRGHFVDGRSATVLVNALATNPYAARYPAGRFVVGATIVEKLDGDRPHEPGPWFVMAKQKDGYYPEGGDWEYAVVDADGSLSDRGQLAGCARCHAEASSDWVFGLP